MLNFMAICILAIIVAGFGVFFTELDADLRVARTTPAPAYITYSTCFEGVRYLSVGHGLTVQLDIDGKPVPCNTKNTLWDVRLR